MPVLVAVAALGAPNWLAAGVVAVPGFDVDPKGAAPDVLDPMSGCVAGVDPNPEEGAGLDPKPVADVAGVVVAAGFAALAAVQAVPE